MEERSLSRQVVIVWRLRGNASGGSRRLSCAALWPFSAGRSPFCAPLFEARHICFSWSGIVRRGLRVRPTPCCQAFFCCAAAYFSKKEIRLSLPARSSAS